MLFILLWNAPNYILSTKIRIFSSFAITLALVWTIALLTSLICSSNWFNFNNKLSDDPSAFALRSRKSCTFFILSKRHSSISLNILSASSYKVLSSKYGYKQIARNATDITWYAFYHSVAVAITYSRLLLRITASTNDIWFEFKLPSRCHRPKQQPLLTSCQ